jgi:hypothetical protein
MLWLFFQKSHNPQRSRRLEVQHPPSRALSSSPWAKLYFHALGEPLLPSWFSRSNDSVPKTWHHTWRKQFRKSRDYSKSIWGMAALPPGGHRVSHHCNTDKKTVPTHLLSCGRLSATMHRRHLATSWPKRPVSERQLTPTYLCPQHRLCNLR